MTTFLIGYDLNKKAPPGQYDDLIKAIKGISGTHWHCMYSTWIVVSELSSKDIRDRLLGYLDSNDKLLVVQLGRSASWHGFSPEGSSWLLKQLGK